MLKLLMAIATPSCTSFKKRREKPMAHPGDHTLKQSILGSIQDHIFLEHSVVWVDLLQ